MQIHRLNSHELVGDASPTFQKLGRGDHEAVLSGVVFLPSRVGLKCMESCPGQPMTVNTDEVSSALRQQATYCYVEIISYFN